MLNILKLIPQKIWIIIGIFILWGSSIWYVQTTSEDRGFQDGYRKAEREYNEASLKLLRDDLSAISLGLGKVLDKQRSDAEASQRMAERLSQVETNTKKSRELLDAAKKSVSENNPGGLDCTFPPEFILLLKSLDSGKEDSK